MTNNLRFFNKKDFLTLSQIIEITGAKPHRNADLSTKIFDIKPLDVANSNEISFLNSGQYLEKFYNS